MRCTASSPKLSAALLGIGIKNSEYSAGNTKSQCGLGQKTEEAKDRKMSFYAITVDGKTAKAFREDFCEREAVDLALQERFSQLGACACRSCVPVLRRSMKGRVWTDLTVVSWCEKVQQQFVLEVLLKL